MSLPLELWRPIIANVGPAAKDTLAALAQVNHFLQHESERILYRSIILRHADDPLAHALSSRRRALLVEECSLYLPPTHARPASKTQAVHPLLALLARLRNLASLSIRGPLPPALKAPSFPFRLRTFCTTEPLSRPLIALLRAQPSITRLTLLNPTLVPQPPSSTPAPCTSLAHALSAVLPSTTHLATLTPAPALAILPHRPVTHLHILTWAHFPLPPTAPLIGASSGPLRALSCAQGFALSPTDLGLLAMHIPNLAFLADLTLTHALPEYLPALASLPLKTLLINRASPGLESRFSERAVLRALAGVCKTLERVVFTQRVTADYTWERVQGGGADEWCMRPVEDPCEVAADLWRAA